MTRMVKKMSDHWCGSCEKECDVHIVDEGIGHYEFWGQTGNDVQLAVVSDCCDDPVYDDPECMIETATTARSIKQDRLDDEGDRRYQERKEEGW